MTVPGVTPVTTPLPGTMVATRGSPLLQVPPALASLKFVVAPTQTELLPVIAAGSGFTVSVADVAHPVVSLYPMITVPAATPVATPVLETIVAIPVLLLDHDPPVVLSVSPVVSPMQTARLPLIDAGNGLTVTTMLRVHPVTLSR